MKKTIERRPLDLTLAALVAAGCGDLLEVTNPGPIADEALNTPAAMQALVTGMSADLSVAVSTTSIWGSVWSDDLTHSGTLGAPTVFARGTITPQEILEQACTKLIATMSNLETKFKREFSYKDVEAGGVTAAAGEDPYGTAGGAGTGAWGRGRDYLDF